MTLEGFLLQIESEKGFLQGLGSRVGDWKAAILHLQASCEASRVRGVESLCLAAVRVEYATEAELGRLGVRIVAIVAAKRERSVGRSLPNSARTR